MSDGAGARILVVDDVPANVRMLGGMLKTRGYEVISAGGGREGVEKSASERPDRSEERRVGKECRL